MSLTTKIRAHLTRRRAVRAGGRDRHDRGGGDGDFVEIVARRPGFTLKGFVERRYLCASGERAQFAKTSRYSVRIVNSLAGGPALEDTDYPYAVRADGGAR